MIVYKLTNQNKKTSREVVMKKILLWTGILICLIAFMLFLGVFYVGLLETVKERGMELFKSTCVLITVSFIEAGIAFLTYWLFKKVRK